MQLTEAYIITLIDDPDSMKAAKTCLASIKDTGSPILPFIFPAIDKNAAPVEMEKRGLEYSYPLAIERTEQNLVLKPYPTADINKRIGCFMSHFTLWEMISERDPLSYYIILEQDAKFIKKFDQEYFDDVVEREFICSLNSPMGATRKAGVFDQRLREEFEVQNETMIEVTLEDENGEVIDESEIDQEELIDLLHFPIPWIDDKSVPQGLPGNSAYIITPGAAKRLIGATYYLGVWPNDALMCRQIFPDMLFAAYPYYTKVQGNKSTTSL